MVSIKGVYEEVPRYHTVVVKMASMIPLYLITLTLLLFVNGCADRAEQLLFVDNQTDSQKAGLRGPVKNCVLYEVSWQEAFGGFDVSSVDINSSVIYLESGAKDESVYYDMNGMPQWKDEYTYDAGKMTECVSYGCLNADCTDVEPRWSYRNSYDKDGRINMIEGYHHDDAPYGSPGATWVHLYQYYEAENKIIISSYDRYGVLQWKHIDTYNADNQISKSAHYDYGGSIQWRDEFRYDLKGNKVEWTRFDSDGALQWNDKFKYDDDGNALECANYDYRDKLMWKNVYHYTSEDGLQHLDINQAADRENRFDGYGNWTVKVTLKEEKGFGGAFLVLEEIEKRALTYYSH